MGDTIYLFGGSRDPHDLSTVSNALWSLQPALPHTGWQTLPPLPGPPRAGMATAVCANRLFVFGGFHLDGQGQVENLADAYLYTPALRKWQRLADTPLPVEGWMAEVIQNRFILLCGGYATVAFSTDGPVKGFVPDVLVYDVRTNKYTYATPMPHALMDAQPVRVGETLYLAGGEDRPKHRAPWTMIGTVQVR
jgi:N-acetylneuraminic acid mutarotase